MMTSSCEGGGRHGGARPADPPMYCEGKAQHGSFIMFSTIFFQQTMAVANLRYQNPEVVLHRKEEVGVTFALSPSEFYVTLKRWSKECLEVDRTQAVGTRTLEHPQVGDMCLVQFFVRLQPYWNRAEILEMSNDGNATILFVDFGNKTTVQRTELFELDDERLLNYPRLAIKCQLDEVQPNANQQWSEPARRYFEKLQNLKHYDLIATFLSKENDLYLVNLDRQNGSSIPYEMIHLEYAKPLEVNSIHRKKYKITKSKNVF